MTKRLSHWLPLILTLFLLGGMLANAQEASPPTVNACYSNRTGALRVLLTSQTACGKGETAITWPANVTELQTQVSTLQTQVADLQTQVDFLLMGQSVVFVTSARYSGFGFGGLAGADSACGDRATAAGLPGTFKAWLSDSQRSAADRLTHSPVPYVRPDGVKIADDWADLVDGSLYAPIQVDENGVLLDANDPSVWTGTQATGAGDSLDRNCGGWSSNTATGSFGTMLATDAAWTDFNTWTTCGYWAEFRLYCFEQ